MLWPHADECHRTAEGERETEVTELALESDFRQEQREAGGEGILNCLLLSRLVAPRCTGGEIKSNTKSLFVLEKMLCIQVPAGAFHKYYRIFVTGQQTHLEMVLLEKKERNKNAHAISLNIMLHNILRDDAIRFLFFPEKKLGQKDKVKFQRLYYPLMAALQ